MSDDSMTAEERLAHAVGRFLADIQLKAQAGLAHPDRRGADNALFDIYEAASDLIAELTEDPHHGHCDTCGAACDRHGCMADRSHAAAIDPFEFDCADCTYRAIDAADLAEHRASNHLATTDGARSVDFDRGDGPRGEEEP